MASEKKAGDPPVELNDRDIEQVAGGKANSPGIKPRRGLPTGTNEDPEGGGE